MSNNLIEAKKWLSRIIAYIGAGLIFLGMIFAGFFMTKVSSPECDNQKLLAQIEDATGLVITDYNLDAGGVVIGKNIRVCRMTVETISYGKVKISYESKYWGADYFIFGFFRIKPSIRKLEILGQE